MLVIFGQHELEHLLFLSVYQFNIEMAEGLSYFDISNCALQFSMTS